MPFIAPKISHYNKGYITNPVDALRDYSYVNFADKNLETVEDLKTVANKLEAVFGNQVKVEVSKDNTLVISADGKDILDVLNVYVLPSKQNQVKYEDGKLIV